MSTAPANHSRPLHVVIVGGGMAGICAMCGLSAALNRRRLRRFCQTTCTGPCQGSHAHRSPVGLGFGFELSSTSGTGTTPTFSSPPPSPLRPAPQTSRISSRTDIAVNVTLIDPKDYLELSWASYRGLFDDHIASTSLISYDDILSSSLHTHVRPLHLQARVISLSLPPFSKYVVTDLGAMLMYDVLILATGSVPTEPVLNAVQPDMAMRTRELREVGDRLMEAKSVLVVGGGHIGAEVAGDVKCFAAMAGNEGCTVTLVQKRKRLVPEYGVSAGEMLKERLHKLGVCVRLGCVAVPLGRRRRPGKEGDHDDDGEPEGEGKEKGNKGCAQKYVIMPTDDVSDADIMHTSPQHGRRPNIATNAATTVATAVENEHQTAPDALNSQNDTDNSSRKQRTIADDNHLTNAHTPISITTPTQSPTPSRTLTRTPPSPSSPPLGGDLIVPDVTFLATGVSPSNPDLLTPSHTPDGWLDVDVFGRLRGCDGSVFAYGDCTRSHPKSAFKAMHNKARLAYNVLAVLDRIREDDAPSMVRERDLYRIVEPPDVAVVTTGPMSGVAKTPVGATSWILPRFKNRTMFVAYARSEIGL